MKMGKFEIETDDLVYIPSDDTFLLAEVCKSLNR